MEKIVLKTVLWDDLFSLGPEYIKLIDTEVRGKLNYNLTCCHLLFFINTKVVWLSVPSYSSLNSYFLDMWPMFKELCFGG